MEKIFYTNTTAYPSSTDAAKEIFADYFQIADPKIARTENGKPYLANGNLFFSVTHTKGGLFIAVCDQNVGVDAERADRELNLPLLLRKFPASERKEMISPRDFLWRWTAKEAAVKWLGGTLSHDLSKLTVRGERVVYKELELPLLLTQIEYEGYLLSVCSERDFSKSDIIIL